MCNELEQLRAEFDAFRQKVSDALEEYFDCEQNGSRSMLEVAETRLRRFIIAKPDPLVEAMNETMPDVDGKGYGPIDADEFRAALAKRGGRIVFDD